MSNESMEPSPMPGTGRSDVQTFRRSDVMLSVIVVNWNTRDLLADCLRSVYETVQDLDFEVFVVDNASTDGSAAMVRERFPGVHLIENTDNVGFARANNQAIAQATGEYLLLLNSDATLLARAVSGMYRFMEEHRSVGVVGCQLLNLDGSRQGSYADFPRLLPAALGRDTRRHVRAVTDSDAIYVDAVSGACMFVRGDALRTVGGMDEGYFLFAEEVDWCYRLGRAGWACCVLPQVNVVHAIGQSRRQASALSYLNLHRSRLKFFRDHYGRVSSMALRCLYGLVTVTKLLAHALVGLARGSSRSRRAVALNRMLLCWLISGDASPERARS